MKDIFIADSHLSDPCTPAYRHLVDFLKKQKGQIDHLILLGDIFEFWVGYRHCVFSAYLEILETLQQLHAAGAKIVMVEGNHDFHVGSFFSSNLNSTIFSDDGQLQLGTNRLYLCHGDTVAATPNYLRLRRFFRSSFAQLLIRILPPDITWRIAEILGNISRKQRHKKPQRQHILPEQSITQYAQHQFDLGCDTFICGHFHQAWHHQLDNRQIIVAGNWGETYHYVVHKDGKFSMKQYQPDTTN